MPLEMLDYSVNRKIEPKLGPKEIYIQGAVEKSELMVLFRYPHLCSGSVCLMKTVSSEMTDRQESIDKYKEWFRFENCYFSALSNTGLGRHLEFINCEFGEIDEETVKAPKNYYYSFTNCRFNTKKK